MPEIIDNKTVKLSFDNQQFESGVQDSLKSLKTLNRSLDTGTNTRSVNELGKSMSVLSAGFHAVTSSAETTIGQIARFTVLGTSIANTVTKIQSSVSNFVKAVTIDPVSTGFQEYNTYIDAFQSIMAGSRKEFGLTNGALTKEQKLAAEQKQLKAISTTLDDLNEYADKTIYNFTQMTNSIGKFTAAGVKLEDSTTAIKGISNLAAMSGATSEQNNRAMYNIAQALQAGSMGTVDWMSIQNAGMGTQEFQDLLVALGRKAGKKIDLSQGFKESLVDKKGNRWLTNDILLKALKIYGGGFSSVEEIMAKMGTTREYAQYLYDLGVAANDAATQVKTVPQLLDTLKEAAQSGWTRTWTLIIGDLSEAKKALTAVSKEIGGLLDASADKRNAILQTWKDLGGRTAILNGIANFYNTFKTAAGSISKGMGLVIKGVTGKQLAEISKQFEKLGNNFKQFFGRKDVQNWLTIISYKLASIAKFAAKLFISIKFGTIIAGIKLLLKYFKPIGSVIVQVTKSVTNVAYEITRLFNAISTSISKALRNSSLASLSTKVSGWCEAIIAWIKSVENTVVKSLRRITNKFSHGSLKQGVMEIMQTLFRLKPKTAEGFVNFFVDAYTKVRKFISKVSEAISFFKSMYIQASGLLDSKSAFLAALRKTFMEYAPNAVKVLDSIIFKIPEIKEAITNSGIYNAVKKVISAFKDKSFKEGITTLVETLFHLKPKAAGDFVEFFINAYHAILNFGAKVSDAIALFKRLYSTASGIVDSKSAFLMALKLTIHRYAPGILNFISNLKTKIIEIKNTIQNSGIYKTLAPIASFMYKGMKEIGQHLFGGLIKGLNDKIAELKAKVIEKAKLVIAWFKDTFDINSPSLVMFWMGKMLIAGLAAGIMAAVGDGSIKAGFKKILNYITSGEILEDFKTAMSWLSGKLGTAVSGAFDMIGKGVPSVASSIWNWVKSLPGKVSSYFGDLDFGGTFSSIVSSVGSILNDFWDWIQNTSSSAFHSIAEFMRSDDFNTVVTYLLDAYLKIAKASALIGTARGTSGLGKMLKSMAEMGDSLTSGGKGLVSAIKGLKENLKTVDGEGLMDVIGNLIVGKQKTMAKDSWGSSLLKLAISIGILVGALYILSKMSWSMVLESLGKMSLVIGLMRVLAAGAKSVNGRSFLYLAGAITLMLIPIAIFTFIDMDTVLSSLAKMIIVLKTIQWAAKGSSGGSAMKGLVGTAIAMLLFAYAIKKLGKMEPDVLLQGIIAITAIMALIRLSVEGFTKNSKKVKSAIKGMIGMAVGLIIIVYALKVLAAMNIFGLAKAIIAFSALMLILRTNLKKLKKVEISGFVGLGVAIMLMAGAVYMLSVLPTRTLAKSLAALAIIGLIIAAISKMMGTVGKLKGVFAAVLLLVTLTGALLIFTECITTLTELTSGSNSLLSVAETFALFIGALAGAISLLGMNFFGSLGGFLILAGILVGLWYVINELGKCFENNSGLVTTLYKGGEVLSAFGYIIGAFISNFAAGLSAGLPTIAENLSTFMTNLEPFLKGARQIKSDATNGALQLAAMLAGIFSSELIGLIIGIFNKKSVAEIFGDDVITVFRALQRASLMSKTISKHSSSMSKAIKVAEDMTDVIHNLAPDSLFEAMGWTITPAAFKEKIDNIFAVMSTFADQSDDGKGKGLANLTYNGIGDTVKIAGDLTTMLRKLPSNSLFQKLENKWFGDDTDIFAKQITTVVTGISTFAEEMPKLDQKMEEAGLKGTKTYDIEKIKNLVYNLTSMLGQIDGYEWYEKLSIIDTDAETFSNDINVIVAGCTTFAESLDTFDKKLKKLKLPTNKDGSLNIERMKSLMTSLGQLVGGIHEYSTLEKISWLEVDTDAETFSKDITTLCDALTTYAGGLSEIDDDTFDNAGKVQDIVTDLCTFVDTLDTSGSILKKAWEAISQGSKWETLSKIASSMEEFGNKFSAFSNGISTTRIATNNFDAITTFILEFHNWTSTYKDVIDEFVEDSAEFSKIFNTIGELTGDFYLGFDQAYDKTFYKSYDSGFIEAAASIFQSLIDLFELGSWKEVEAFYAEFDANAVDMANGFRNGVLKMAEVINGTDKELGDWTGGITQTTGSLWFNAGKKAAEDFVAGIKAHAVDQLSDTQYLINLLMGDTGLDVNPVITPIVDLTNVTAASAEINSLMNAGTALIGSTTQKNVGGLMHDTGKDINAISNEVKIISGKVDDLASAISSIELVLDTGTLVGEISNKIDRYQGHKFNLHRRGG